MQNVQLFQGPGRKVILLAIIRRVPLVGAIRESPLQGGFYDSFDPYLFPPPLRFAEGQRGGIEGDIPPMLAAQSAFPFLPVPCQVFIEYSIN